MRNKTPFDPSVDSPQHTDWDRYYSRPYRGASLTRAVSQAYLLSAMRRYVHKNSVIAELGGANSCFFDAINEGLRPAQYHIYDTNSMGLERFRVQKGLGSSVFLHHQDVRSLRSVTPVDLAFSVGLIEHFDTEGTRAAVEAHFAMLKPGGIVLITFPTSTWLYRLTRGVAERTGNWIFHDERPLGLAEVAEAAGPFGALLERRIIWPILLTQYHVLWRKLPTHSNDCSTGHTGVSD